MERLCKEMVAVPETLTMREKMPAAALQVAARYGEAFEESANDEFNQWKAIASAERIVAEE